MLIQFEVENFRSIADPVVLTAVAIDRDRIEARNFSVLGEELLPVIAIYGPNASGKSNILAAIQWLQLAVTHSLRLWDETIPLTPFALNRGKGEKPTNFSLDYEIRGIRYEYILEINSDEVIYEALFHYPEKKRRRIFEREGLELKLQRGLGSLSGTRSLLTGRTLVLSAANRFHEPILSEFVDALKNIQTFGLPRPYDGRIVQMGGGRFRRNKYSSVTARWFEGDDDQDFLFDFAEESPFSSKARQRALGLLKLADLGISDVLIDEVETRYPDGGSTKKEKRLRLVHDSSGHGVPLDFASESRGTQEWFNLIGPILEAISNGSLLVFDELDASLHPTLSAAVLALFKDPVSNPNGAQLIFTTHDTSLLNHLNRDEVWLTEKRPDGSTRLGPLAEFAGERVRRSVNLEQGYLTGRFGAIPDIDGLALYQSLGIVG